MTVWIDRFANKFLSCAGWRFVFCTLYKYFVFGGSEEGSNRENTTKY